MLMPDNNTADVAHVIQLAVAPVFLLAGVAGIINMLSTRIGRIVDRMRVLEDRLLQIDPEKRSQTQNELTLNVRRLHLIYVSMTLEVVCALLVGLMIAIAFIDAFMIIDMSMLIAALFIGGMVSFNGALLVFLYEIFLAVNSARKKAAKDSA